MPDDVNAQAGASDRAETQEWLESLEYVLKERGPERARDLLKALLDQAHRAGVDLPFTANTPYVNTIPVAKQPPYPGNREIERRIKSIIRWNAMAMVVRANREHEGIGGHISTYASAATLFEVGFHHFFRGKGDDWSGDQIYFQGHAAPGVYARAFLEGRLSVEQLENFRREIEPGRGLSSYPHPWLMPDFWEFSTVSMGLGPIMAIYQARFNHYLQDRRLKDTQHTHVWAFLGDGEMDEPEALGAITLAAREKLDNLIFVINCNLQRLDGPVRGNGKIIQELEAAFRGAGWNVLKVIWGSDWDSLLAQDTDGLLVQRMEEVVDGQYQKYVVESGDYIRRDFFGAHPQLLERVAHLSDEELRRLRRGGHDPDKIYAAYRVAVEHEGAPTVILAKTIKGYGLGEAGEGRNVTHQQKKLNEDELREFRARFGIPISDEEVAQAPFYRPPEDSPEMRYLRERRERLGGYVPSRVVAAQPLKAPSLSDFQEFLEGTKGREVSTTMAFVRMLSQLLRHPEIGPLIVPIVPDEARTFGMEPLFRQCGIYSHAGQLYDPVDSDTLLYYREAKDGQILEEGITEAGSLSSFIAAGTAYATHRVNTIPFFLFYSMFGFQRVGDLIWAAADMRCKGFLLGGTAGRTTLAGEGLQHQDGHSHLLATTVPNLRAYDPAFACEIAVIVQDGIRRMYEAQEDVFYYLTLGNENYAMPPMPEGVQEGILQGLYKFKAADGTRGDCELRIANCGLPGSENPKSEIRNPKSGGLRAHLFGSGAILREALRAQEILADFEVAADVWSATSYQALRQEALSVERWNRLHPEEEPRVPYVTRLLAAETSLEGSYTPAPVVAAAPSLEGSCTPAPVVAASDYLKAVPDQIAPWVPGGLYSLGTDGFGRSDIRPSLRRFFEVDAESMVVATLYQLAKRGDLDRAVVQRAIREFGLDPDRPEPVGA